MYRLRVVHAKMVGPAKPGHSLAVWLPDASVHMSTLGLAASPGDLLNDPVVHGEQAEAE